MSSAREILEYAKQAGWIDIATGVRLITREYLQGTFKEAPRVIETSPGHKIEIVDVADFDFAPYWFFVEPEEPEGKVQFYYAQDEKSALIAIEAAGNLSGSLGV